VIINQPKVSWMIWKRSATNTDGTVHCTPTACTAHWLPALYTHSLHCTLTVCTVTNQNSLNITTHWILKETSWQYSIMSKADKQGTSKRRAVVISARAQQCTIITRSVTLHRYK
jgi:hypothetical protein